MKKLLSLIFKGLSLFMKGLKYFLGYFMGGFGLLVLIFESVSRLFGDKSEGFLQIIQSRAIYFIICIVCLAIGGICALLEEKFDDKSKHLDILSYYHIGDTHSTSSNSYSGASSYTGSSGSYGPIDHDALDAVQYAMKITETYGDDWKGYDPEAPDPSLDTYSTIDI